MSKFKVGDRVRYKHDNGPWIESQLSSDSEGVVVSEKGDFSNYHNYESVNVQFGLVEDIDVEDLELIKPTDQKTAFLEELRDLLAKYDTELTWRVGARINDKILLTHPRIEVNAPAWSFSFVQEGELTITADNIMGYNKE